MVRVLIVLAMLAGVAQADVPSPEQEMCIGKEAGDSCDGGACVMAKCSRARPDGAYEFDCVTCVPGAGGGGNTGRIVIGCVVAVIVIGGGIWLARRMLK